jgi:ATP-dependent Clp protease ATP-binding subunit ClpC
LLRRLRQDDPRTTLVDAQHALAREYGFPSWPKLKAHVESVAAPPAPVTFDRYTPRARQAIFFARYEAARLGSTTIEPEHLLLGLIRGRYGLKGRFFESIALSLDDARAELSPGGVAVEPLSSSVQIPVSERAKDAFRAAAAEADAAQHQEIGTVHLLLAVLRAAGATAVVRLARRGLRVESVRWDLELLRDEEPGP